MIEDEDLKEKDLQELDNVCDECKKKHYIFGPGGQTNVILGSRGALGAWISEF